MGSSFNLKYRAYCVDCGDYIAEGSVESHMTSNPNHAILNIYLDKTGTPLAKIGRTGSTIIGAGNPNTLAVSGNVGQHYWDSSGNIMYVNTDNGTTWIVV